MLFSIAVNIFFLLKLIKFLILSHSYLVSVLFISLWVVCFLSEKIFTGKFSLQNKYDFTSKVHFFTVSNRMKYNSYISPVSYYLSNSNSISKFSKKEFQLECYLSYLYAVGSSNLHIDWKLAYVVMKYCFMDLTLNLVSCVKNELT